MSKIIHIAIALLLLTLIAPASAQQSTFRDATASPALPAPIATA